jgi:hypothetical protein
LEGLFELRQRPRRSLWAFMLRPGRVSVTVGTALRFGTDEDPGEITMKLEQVVADLGRSDNTNPLASDRPHFSKGGLEGGQVP